MGVLSLQSLKVAKDDGEESGLLVFHHDLLVAVLACLAQPIYHNEQDHWHLEIGFGRCSCRPMTFPKLDAALRWIAERLGVDSGEASACAHAHLDRANGHASH